MGLLLFDTRNMTSKKPGDIQIRFHRSGRMSLSKGAVEAFDLEPGDTVSFIQDENEEADWYIVFGHKSGFMLHRPGNRSGLEFNSASMANSFLDALEIPDTSVAFKIAKTPADAKFEESGSKKPMAMYAIFTSQRIK